MALLIRSDLIMLDVQLKTEFGKVEDTPEVRGFIRGWIRRSVELVEMRDAHMDLEAMHMG